MIDPTALKINVTYPGDITKTVEYNDETKNDFTFDPPLNQAFDYSDVLN